MTATDIETVLEWHSALNAAETDRLLELSTDDVEVGGPRGAGRGAQLLSDWVARAQIQLEPVRWQDAKSVVVVEQTARWLTPEGQLSEPQTAASVFRVRDGKVSSVLRFGSMAEALEFAGIEPSPSA
jgi:ketosteroid isomerase-like protein